MPKSNMNHKSKKIAKARSFQNKHKQKFNRNEKRTMKIVFFRGIFI